VLAAVLALGTVGAASRAQSAPSGGAAPRRVARLVDKHPRALVTPERAGGQAWAKSLGEVAVHNRNTGASAKLRLYRQDGTLDPAAAKRFMAVASSERSDGPEPAEQLPERLVQLVFRASYHFKGADVVIVSATRKGARGRHGAGEAIDFQLTGVKAPALAAFLRATPRAGVGIYTHPKTQYVHLDVRDHSYHWLDGSPPGVKWRERLLPDPKQAKRDASYRPVLDLPERAGG
jgi:uncharacterized protein YcbK (DUF882 family)